MARIDREERRRVIAAAVWRLLEDGGVEAASVRAVVASTGLSSGSVRFFFSTQAELREFAMATLAERVAARVRAAAASESDPARRAVAMLAELMPLRDDTERELGVWLQFVARSRHEPALARIVAAQADAVRALLVSVLRDLVAAALRPADLDIRLEAIQLNAVIDGLLFELLTAPALLSRADATAALRRALLPGGADR